MYRIFIVLCILTLALENYAQTKNVQSKSNVNRIDSLATRFNAQTDEIEKIEILLNIPKRYEGYADNPSKIYNLYHQGFTLAEKKNQKAAVSFLIEMAFIQMYLFSDEPKAFKLYYQALTYAENDKNYAACASISYELAVISEHQNLKDQIFFFFNKVIDYNEKTSVIFIKHYRWLIELLLEDKKNEEALKTCYHEIKYLNERSGDIEYKVLAYGKMYQVLKTFPNRSQEADIYRKKTLHLLSQINSLKDDFFLDELAITCNNVGQYQLAIKFASQILKWKETSSRTQIHYLLAYQIIANSYEYLGQYDKSLENYKRYAEIQIKVLRESITLESGRKIIRANGDQNLLLKQQEVNNERFFRNLSVAIAMFVLLLGLIIFIFYRREQQQKKELSKLNATKDKLFAILSHDFRSPLANLQTFMNLINWGALSQAEFAESVGGFNIQLNNVQTMLENILNWSITQMGGISPKKAENNLHDVIDEQINLYYSVAHLKQIKVINNIPATATIFADSNHLKIIFRNLLQNALKFTNSQGEIVFNFLEQNSKKTIIIKDNGIGLTTEKLSTIFTFNKSDSVLGTYKEEGTGLGLTLVHELVKANNGSIKVESILKEGTTFLVFFAK